jgi:hypothetical protein
MAFLSACGASVNQVAPEIVPPPLPVTVEGIVFNTPRFSQWTSDQRRVGFRNVQIIRQTHVVTRGRRVSSLPQARQLLDLSGFTYSYEERERTFDDYVTQMSVAGLLVIHDGEIVVERYAAGQTFQRMDLVFGSEISGVNAGWRSAGRSLDQKSRRFSHTLCPYAALLGIRRRYAPTTLTNVFRS